VPAEVFRVSHDPAQAKRRRRKSGLREVWRRVPLLSLQIGFLIATETDMAVLLATPDHENGECAA
jgi:hypothetical protein